MSVPSGHVVTEANAVMALAPFQGQLTRELEAVGGLPKEKREEAVQKLVDQMWGDAVRRLRPEGLVGGPKNAAQARRPEWVKQQVFDLFRRAAQVVKNLEVLQTLKTALATHDAERAQTFSAAVHGAKGWVALKDGRMQGQLVRPETGTQTPRTPVTEPPTSTGGESNNLSTPAGDRKSAGAAARKDDKGARTADHGDSTSSGATHRDQAASTRSGLLADARKAPKGEMGEGSTKTTARGAEVAAAAPRSTENGKPPPTPQGPARPYSAQVQASTFLPQDPTAVAVQREFSALTVRHGEGASRVPETIAGAAEPDSPVAALLDSAVTYVEGKGAADVSPGERAVRSMADGFRLCSNGQLTRFAVSGSAAVIASNAAYAVKATKPDGGVDLNKFRMGQRRGEKSGLDENQDDLLNVVARYRIREGSKNLNRV